jgi:hypothetical protein
MRAPFALASSVLVLAACGGTVVFEEDGGEGGAPTTSNVSGVGGSPETTSVSSADVAVVGTTASAVNATSSDGSGICGTNVTLLDGTEDTCLGDACCDFFSSCAANGAAACQACLDAGGGFECEDALKCSREAACWAGVDECQSGLQTGDPGVDQCLVDFCCFDSLVCTQAGADVQGCWECVEQGGGTRCDGLFRCAENSCDGGGGGGGPDGGICDTGYSTSDPGIDQCLTGSCCGPFLDCLDDGEPECIDCLNDGGGPQCEETAACFQEACGFDADGRP